MSSAAAFSGTNTSIGQLIALASVEAAKAALPHDAIASGGRASGVDHDAVPVFSAASKCSISVKR